MSGSLTPPRITLTLVEQMAAQRQLSVLGGFNHSNETRNLPTQAKSLILLGPLEPGFWSSVTASAEFQDGNPDPLDRWSQRIISELAKELGGAALFPSDGPPYLPFFAWATDTGRCWPSPVSMLVHDDAGLMLSIRGALALPVALTFPEAGRSPCEICEAKPCLSACPVGALSDGGYDIDSCHSFLDTAAGEDCMNGGCKARLACPISRRYPRDPAQSAFHMRAFHRIR